VPFDGLLESTPLMVAGSELLPEPQRDRENQVGSLKIRDWGKAGRCEEAGMRWGEGSIEEAGMRWGEGSIEEAGMRWGRVKEVVENT
jgi:hypothetical protein